MSSPHPKITSYIPKAILEALDNWKSESGLESRNAAIVAILADYLGVPYSVPEECGKTETVPRKALSTALAELLQRVQTLESVVYAAQNEALSTVSDEVLSAVQSEVLSEVQTEDKAPDTVPTAVLSAAQSEVLGEVQTEDKALDTAIGDAPKDNGISGVALSKRLGVTETAVRKAKRKGNEYLAAWSRERDPDRHSWVFLDGGKYHQVQ